MQILTKHARHAVVFLTLVASSQAQNCLIDWTEIHQRIDGFGASSAFNGSWTETQADMFFSTNTGIGLSLLRSRIAPDGTTLEAGIMQIAQARGARVWSTPWSPPAIYKDSGTVDGGNFVSTAENYQGYANQLAGYVASIKTNYGIQLYALSIQNEPNYDTPLYESCQWSGEQLHEFIPYLANSMSHCGVAATQIMLAEEYDWDFALLPPTLNDPVTAPTIGIVAAHNYGGAVVPVDSQNKALWETEVSTLDDFDGSITNALYWAGQIHAFMTVAEVNAWHYWWLIPIDGFDNEGLTDMAGNPAKRMYVLGNYSRFVRPGYYRIGANNDTPDLLISAYKDPASGTFAIVAANPSSSTITQTFTFTNFTADTLTPWVTSDSASLESNAPVVVVNSTFSYDFPPLSVVTFVGQHPNQPPSLLPVSDQTVDPGFTVVVTNVSVEPNVPPLGLTFSLLSAPNNATLTPLDSTSAVFSWRAAAGLANTTNQVQVMVSDLGTPSLSATNVFNVVVNPLTSVGFSSVTLSNQIISLVVTGATGATGPDYLLLASTNLVDWQLLSSALAPSLPLTFTDTNSSAWSGRFYKILLNP